MRAKYRRLMIGMAIVLPMLAAGGAIAEPRQPFAEPIQWTNPAALAPGGAGITPQVTRLELGSFDAPAAGVHLTDQAPEGSPRLVKARTLRVVRASTARFSAVGVSWRETDRVGAVDVAVRGHVPGGDWGAWQSVGVAENDRDLVPGPMAATARPRGGSDLIWLGPSDGVELAVSIRSGRAPHDLAADLIDPMDAPSDANPVPATQAESAPGSLGVPMPPVIRRTSWGADERQMHWRPQYAPLVKAVVVHHTATGNSYSEADVPKIMRSIYRYQTVSRGWGDIGYNVLVDRFGRLWEGRSGGLSRPVVGAHAGGYNTGTAGIAVIGNYSTIPVPGAAVESAARYTAWKLSLGPAVDPRSTVSLTGGGSTSRFQPGTTITVPRVLPHRQTNPTECPGNRGMEALPIIRERAAQLLGDLMKPETLRPRLAVWRPSDATFRVMGAEAPIFTGTPGDVPAPADYDGDGRDDAAAWTPASGTWKIVMSGDGSTQTAAWGGPADKPVPADYDGDGRADLAVWRAASAEWIIRNVGQFYYGASGDVPVPGDYNGDGAADAAVWRPAGGIWYMRNAGEFRLGEAWHKPVPADYNGDGITDPASWSPVSQRFFIRGMAPIALGALGDLPAAAQYDGDGRTDFAVYHTVDASHAQFQIRGRNAYEFGAPGDIPMPLR
jgi:hypothetical protein